MKIIYYSAHPHLNLSANTGYGTHMREVIDGFKQQGHQVKTLIIGGEGQIASEASNNSKYSFKQKFKNLIPSIIWETIKDFQLLKTDKKSLLKLEKIINEYQPDFIYERGYYLLKSGLTASLKHNIPYFIELNAPYVEERVEFSGKSLLLSKAKKTELFQLTKSTAVVVVSSALKKYFTEISPVIEGKTLVTPNAINPNKIELSSQNQTDIKKKYHLTNKTVIGFVGSIFPYHGVDLLIEAFSRIKNTENQYKLLIVGDGEILSNLKKLSKLLKVEKNIIFTGKVDHQFVFDYINIMNITVMPQSNWYGSPVKIFEYGFLKKAVIAPNYVPLKDVLTQGYNGIMIEPSINNLKIEIEKLITNPQLAKEIGTQFQQDIVNKYTWNKVAKNILNFLNKKNI